MESVGAARVRQEHGGLSLRKPARAAPGPILGKGEAGGRATLHSTQHDRTQSICQVLCPIESLLTRADHQ